MTSTNGGKAKAVYCIGLMSGTSVDGIDAVLVKMGEQEGGLPVQLLAGATYPYPPQLRKKILAACEGAPLSLAELAALDDAIAAQFALAAQKIQEGHPPAQLIGSHGQTVLHRSPLMGDGKQPAVVELGYSLQLGRGETIAHLTGVATVSNFRAADVAAGGQGAPLVPKVDAYLLSHPSRHRCIQNLGGIGNLTYLPPSQQEGWQEAVWGWDTGPGNVLLDLAVQRLTQGRETYDRDGSWAARGTPCQALVEQWLQGDFFRTPPPKSTGRELFGEAYLTRCWQQSRGYQLSEADWLASLTELTAASIARSYQDFLPKMPDEVLLCGGGSHNAYLRQRLQVQLPPETVLLTVDEVGIDSDFKEAIAFAVLAYWRFYASIPGNLPLVTGAKRAVLLGEIHFPFA